MSAELLNQANKAPIGRRRVLDTQPPIFPVGLTSSQTSAVELDLMPNIVRGINKNFKGQRGWLKIKNPEVDSNELEKSHVLGMLDAYRARRDGPAGIQKFISQRVDGDYLLGQFDRVMGDLSKRKDEVTAFAANWSDKDIDMVRIGTQAYVSGLPKWLQGDIYHNFSETGLHAEKPKDRVARNFVEIASTATTTVLTDLAAAAAGGIAIGINAVAGPIPDSTPALIATGAYSVATAAQYWRDVHRNGKVAVGVVEKTGVGPNYFATRGMNIARRYTSNPKIIRKAGIAASYVPRVVEEFYHAPVVIAGALTGHGAVGAFLTFGSENAGADLMLKPITVATRKFGEGTMPKFSKVKTLFHRRSVAPSAGNPSKKDVTV